MSNSLPRLLVTGANGALGRLVVDRLLAKVPSSRIVAMVRGAEGATRLTTLGVEVRLGDYSQPESLDAAFAGIDRLLFISSNSIAERLTEHRNVIEAAKRAGVKLVIYTSVLHADISPLGLAESHRQTEVALKASGVPFVLLRNGWYSENYAASIPVALAHGAMIGSAGEGQIASAARADYADAAVAALTTSEDWTGRTFELAGDEAYTLTQFAAEVTRQSGKPVVYQNLPQAAYKAALLGAGLPELLAELLADSDVGASRGALFDDGRELSRLIGRPTTPLSKMIDQALAKVA